MHKKQPLVNVEELATILKISKHTVYFWVHTNKIPYYKVSNRLRFDPKVVLEEILRPHNGSLKAEYEDDLNS